MSLINEIINLPAPLLSHWGYLVILFAALLETAPLFGLLIPGQLIVILGGLLVKLKILEIGDVIFISAFGAIAGDYFGYLIGKKYGYAFITKFGKYFFLKEERFKKIQPLVNQNLGQALIIGRFNSLTRAFAPFVAGASKIPLIKFLIYNIVGGLSWSIVFVMIGYLFGASYEVLAPHLGRYIFLATLISAVLIYLYKYINRKKSIFYRYHLYALLTSIGSLYLFAKLIEDVIDQELVTHWDVWINQNVIHLWQPTLNKIMIFITNISSPTVMIILAAGLLLSLLYRKRIYYSLLLLFGMAGGLVLEILTKLIVQRARPINGLLTISSYSFPSGHATMALLFFSLVIYIFHNDFNNKIIKNLFIGVNVLLILLIGFSRIYLNVHWLSDVLAGLALGLFWLTVLILIFRVLMSLANTTLETIKHLLKKANHLPS
ncbi:MAG: hypothetical protein COX77_02620 [Candidatus Komeilibacteria bacterium CG_4_10_14_0_2_um_filter_37_10]|uniref:Phosphatidic acid phosphatase type 2/haloperoxidase domain-containing protein n=1 Tax=Candidatus Komeilibacteria bacterium CG_4_10_14_0_2_um_filter_37_10 TaxID=1974470 RepID=A0A2M7VET7_9BACT|nr:MAG: hypothetical protein COX77_02620 [Candidatus Komeilibacteria bacterium CG_4_10_14_0_2_um_filter_37_10]